jgi:hypothetical protein
MANLVKRDREKHRSKAREKKAKRDIKSQFLNNIDFPVQNRNAVPWWMQWSNEDAPSATGRQAKKNDSYHQTYTWHPSMSQVCTMHASV